MKYYHHRQQVPDLTDMFQRLEKEIDSCDSPEGKLGPATPMEQELERKIVSLRALNSITESALSAKVKELAEAQNMAKEYEKQIEEYKETIAQMEADVQVAKQEPTTSSNITVEELISASRAFNNHSRRLIMATLNQVFATRSGDALQLIDAEIQTIDSIVEAAEDVPDEKGRTQKVIIQLLFSIFQKLGITAVSDNVPLARLFGYIGGYSSEKVRQNLSSLRLTSSHTNEVNKVNEMLKDVNCEISINIDR